MVTTCGGRRRQGMFESGFLTDKTSSHIAPTMRGRHAPVRGQAHLHVLWRRHASLVMRQGRRRVRGRRQQRVTGLLEASLPRRQLVGNAIQGVILLIVGDTVLAIFFLLPGNDRDRTFGNRCQGALRFQHQTRDTPQGFLRAQGIETGNARLPGPERTDGILTLGHVRSGIHVRGTIVHGHQVQGKFPKTRERIAHHAGATHGCRTDGGITCSSIPMALITLVQKGVFFVMITGLGETRPVGRLSLRHTGQTVRGGTGIAVLTTGWSVCGMPSIRSRGQTGQGQGRRRSFHGRQRGWILKGFDGLFGGGGDGILLLLAAAAIAIASCLHLEGFLDGRRRGQRWIGDEHTVSTAATKACNATN